MLMFWNFSITNIYPPTLCESPLSLIRPYGLIYLIAMSRFLHSIVFELSKMEVKCVFLKEKTLLFCFLRFLSYQFYIMLFFTLKVDIFSNKICHASFMGRKSLKRKIRRQMHIFPHFLPYKLNFLPPFILNIYTHRWRTIVFRNGDMV